MPTTDDLYQAQAERAAWSFDPDQVQPETTPSVSPKSSAAKLAAGVQEGRKAHLKDRAEAVDQLQAQRKRRKAERAKTAGLTTAEILAALGVPARRRAG